MSATLNQARDGIVGHWPRPTDDATVPVFDTSDVDYLDPSNRATIYDAILSDTLVVKPRNGNVAVRAPGAAGKIANIIRPAQIPADQLEWVRTYADLRVDRASEIVIQTSDTLSFFGTIETLGNSRRKYTGEFLAAVYRLTVKIEMQVKHHSRLTRPQDLCDQVQPLIQTPDHSSFPSGHACEAFAMATVLNRLSRDEGPVAGTSGGGRQVFRMAHRIATNRTIAGVHYPMDSAAGALLGCAIGEHVMGLVSGAQPAESVTFYLGEGEPSDPPHAFGPSSDFTLDYVSTNAHDHGAPAQPAAVEDSALSVLYTRAKAEWS